MELDNEVTDHGTEHEDKVPEDSPHVMGNSAADSDSTSTCTTPDRDHQVLLLMQTGGGSLNRAVVQQVIEEMGGYSASRRPNSRIDVWLESPGGDAHAAYKLGLFLRAAFEEVVFVIVDYAKSAATLLSLAGDRIYMAPAAELGPLDTQESREGEVKFRSYLETADAIDNLFSMAAVNAIAAGGLVLSKTGLTRESTIQNMMKFAADFSRPLLEQIDPTAVIAANTSLRVAAEYGSRLLSYRNDRDGIGKARAQTDQLIRGYPTHGYVIDRDEAREVLDLPIEPLEDYEYLTEVEALYSSAQQQGNDLVGVFDIGTVTEIVGSSNDENDVQSESDSSEPTSNDDQPEQPTAQD